MIKTYILKRKTFIYHFLFWLAVYLFWIIVFRSYSITLTKTITVEFCYLIFITADYYAINFIMPRLLAKKKYSLFISVTLLIIAVSAWLRALVARQMNLHFFHGPVTDFGTLYFNSFINISFWVLLITTGKMFIDRKQTQLQLELLQKERTKNELDYLKAQINPHALFNSLNTIYGHIDKSNQVARNILLQFSELLRYQLYDCSAEKVSLEKEIAYIKNYVGFQRLRKDEKLRVDVQIENIGAGLQIAPLLLVVIIENAFKFVSSFSDRENKIVIKIDTRDNCLYCVFTNTKELNNIPVNENTGGIGLTNLRRRLQLLYPSKHELTTNITNDIFETTLIINLA